MLEMKVVRKKNVRESQIEYVDWTTNGILVIKSRVKRTTITNPVKMVIPSSITIPKPYNNLPVLVTPFFYSSDTWGILGVTIFLLENLKIWN